MYTTINFSSGGFMHFKFKNEMDTTDNQGVYKRARKRQLENEAKIDCSYCHYHRGENAEKYQRSWKKLRKTQYKTV